MVCRGESVCLELLSVLNPIIQKEDTSEKIYQSSVVVSQKVEQPSIMVCASRRDTKVETFFTTRYNAHTDRWLAQKKNVGHYTAQHTRTQSRDENRFPYLM